MGNFVEEQKAVNAQANQRIDTVKSTLNKKMSNLHSKISQKHDSLQAEISQKYDNLEYLISRLSNQQQVQKKGKFPSQTQPNPRGLHEVSFSSEPNSKMDEVKEIITLRSSKELKQPASEVVKKGQEVEETEPEEVVIKQTAEKNSTPPPFPQALKAKKKAINQAERLEVLRQVKVNIPLLDMIKQVPTYAKILKDFCIVKRGLNVGKKAFLTKQVSAIIQCKTPVKYKDPGCLTISVNIGGTCEKRHY